MNHTAAEEQSRMKSDCIHVAEAVRSVAATQTVDISGASATMQAGGEPRRGQDLPDSATKKECE
jgi:hypothetical protein